MIFNQAKLYIVQGENLKKRQGFYDPAARPEAEIQNDRQQKKVRHLDSDVQIQAEKRLQCKMKRRQANQG